MSSSKSFIKKKFNKRLLIFVVIFAALGAYLIYLSFASPYNPYNPPSETGIATYYDNPTVGGPGHCAAIHYARGKKLKVTNKNPASELYNTSIKCIVSDAGPFGDGRVVDLNTNDFIKLAGSRSVGVLKVKLELVTEPKSEPEPSLEINCDSAVSEKTDPQSVINDCEIDQTAISVEPQEEQAIEPKKNAFDRVFDFFISIF